MAERSHVLSPPAHVVFSLWFLCVSWPLPLFPPRCLPLAPLVFSLRRHQNRLLPPALLLPTGDPALLLLIHRRPPPPSSSPQALPPPSFLEGLRTPSHPFSAFFHLPATRLASCFFIAALSPTFFFFPTSAPSFFPRRAPHTPSPFPAQFFFCFQNCSQACVG